MVLSEAGLRLPEAYITAAGKGYCYKHCKYTRNLFHDRFEFPKPIIALNVDTDISGQATVYLYPIPE